jgi:hypothetical protein
MPMTLKNLIKNRFHIYSGLRLESKLVNPLQAGEAYEVNCPKKPYYILKLWAIPHVTYYLCRNKDSNERFTVFSKFIGEYDDPTFRRPIGSGELLRELTTHLEIQFTFPRQRLFMSLFPAQTLIDSLLSQTEDGVREELEL